MAVYLNAVTILNKTTAATLGIFFPRCAFRLPAQRGMRNESAKGSSRSVTGETDLVTSCFPFLGSVLMIFGSDPSFTALVVRCGTMRGPSASFRLPIPIARNHRGNRPWSLDHRHSPETTFRWSASVAR